jgi:hypothetical protein
MPANTTPVAEAPASDESAIADFDDLAEIDAVLGLADMSDSSSSAETKPSTTAATPAVAADVETPEDDEEAEESTTAEEADEEEEHTEETEEEETEEEPEAEEEEEEEKPSLPASVQKRINKLTARAKQAEEELTAIRAERDQLKSTVEGTEIMRLTPDDTDPMADVASAAELNERIASAKRMKQWALNHWDGAEVPAKDGETTYYDAARVRGIFQQADSLLDAAPRKLEYIQQAEAANAEAKQVYPDMFKPGSQMEQVVQSVVRTIPGFLRLPNWRLIIGDALVGGAIRAEQAEKGSAAAAAPAKAKAKTAAAVPGAPKLAPKQPGAAERRSTPASPVERESAATREAAARPTETREDLESWLESVV